WCKKCMQNGWTSGNEQIDKLIQETQRKASAWSDNYLEWINYDQFSKIREIGEGAFSVVYKATWSDGRRTDDKEKRCSRTEPITVALKCIKNSQSITPYYIQNLKTYYRHFSTECPKRILNYLEFYGITQSPYT
ncbi:11054_t:CDS:2, partial [Acaulospora morrowiae]